jgi:hypothetical protein
MEDLVRSEYPSILVRAARLISPRLQSSADSVSQASLQPNQAVHTLNDRVKRINKINVEIADWLQVRIFYSQPTCYSPAMLAVLLVLLRPVIRGSY